MVLVQAQGKDIQVMLMIVQDVYACSRRKYLGEIIFDLCSILEID